MMVGCVFFAIIIGNVSSMVDLQVSVNAHESSQPVILIDPGHGGMDGGAQSKSGALEKNLNLDISKTLKEIFEVNGFKVKMTRETDTSIHDPSANTIRKQKLSDLKNRMDLINQTENGMLISIHQNLFTDSKYSGSQIFYSQNNPLSKDLATQVQQSIVGLIQPDNSREIKPAGNHIYLLREAKIPAIIVECGFLSNEEESSKLANKEYQQKLAFAIYCGFLQHWNNLNI